MSLMFHAHKSNRGASKPSFIQPILPLIPEKPDIDLKVHKDKFIQMELKSRAGATGANASTHKKHIRLFEEGSPQEFIDMLDAVTEIWEQNKITSAPNQSAIVRTILQGESKACHDVAVDDNKAAPGNDVTDADIQAGLDAVALTVFPHRALMTQMHWMQRHMRKPWDLSVRRTMAAINRINNALPKFPGGSAADKFSERELIELLEVALPQSWKQALDFKSFVPSEHTKLEFITECETIERTQMDQKPHGNDNTSNKRDHGGFNNHGNNKRKHDNDSNKRQSGGNKTWKKSKSNQSNNEHCSVHGKGGHDSADCWELHPEKAPQWFKDKQQKKPKESNFIVATKLSKAELQKRKKTAAKRLQKAKEEAKAKAKEPVSDDSSFMEVEAEEEPFVDVQMDDAEAEFLDRIENMEE